jgi:hypothetical protein
MLKEGGRKEGMCGGKDSSIGEARMDKEKTEKKQVERINKRKNKTKKSQHFFRHLNVCVFFFLYAP